MIDANEELMIDAALLYNLIIRACVENGIPFEHIPSNRRVLQMLRAGAPSIKDVVIEIHLAQTFVGYPKYDGWWEQK